jgi:hypothetical protein
VGFHGRLMMDMDGIVPLDYVSQPVIAYEVEDESVV